MSRSAPSAKKGKKKSKKSTSTSGAKRSTSTGHVAQGGPTRTPRESSPSSSTELDLDPGLALAQATRPLLELFAVVDDVFGEPNAFESDKLKAGLGRIYRQWKSSRLTLDPGFKVERHVHEAGE